MKGPDRGRPAAGAIRAGCVAAMVLAAGGAPAAQQLIARPLVVRSAQAPQSSLARDTVGRALADDAPLPVTFASAETVAPGLERLIQGPMEEILYGPDASAAAADALALFVHKLDLTRDLALGDKVRLLVRRATDGRLALDYAELDSSAGAVRLYRRRPAPAFAVDDFAGEDGQGLDRLLLRTPLRILHVTSGFGFRSHPLLGYGRLHRGVDFAAQPGTPVLAAGNGRVAEARWSGGYGLMVRLDHGAGLQTLYAHLSAWGPSLKAGALVRQGQVIGFTGATGLVTGPHLHFEVIQDGRPIDPALARAPAPLLTPAERRTFDAGKAAIQADLARAAARG